MKKNYLKCLFALLSVFAFETFLKAQCSAPAPPSVSGATIAGCVGSASFTLTGTPTGTNQIGWYADPFGGNALTTNSVFTTPTLTAGTTYYVGQSANVSSAIDTLAMPTYSRNVPAQETRGYYFTAPIDFIITGLRAPVAIGGTISGIAVIKLPVAPPLYTNVTNTFSTLYLNQAITGTNIVSVNIPVYAGDIIGVLGERNDTSAYGPNPGNGIFPSTLGVSGPTVNLYRMGMLYNLATQTPTNIWTEQVNTIGIVEMYIKRSCNSTLTPVNVSIVPVPQVTVSPPPTICANTPYTLSASGATSFTWSGGPQTSTYVISPSTTTTYSVQGSILSNCTSSVSTITVSVEPGLPTLTTVSSSSVVCSGDTVVLTGLGATSYTWAGGANSVTNNVGFVPLSTQQYTLYGANSCGVSSKLITVSVNPTPVLVTNANPTVVCEGRSATLTVSGAATYSWEPSSTLGASVVVTPLMNTSYNVTGTSSAGCPASAVQVVVVVPNPTVTIGAVQNKTLVCSGGSATLTSGGADIYSWSSGPTTSSAIVNPLNTQIYTVTGTSTLTQCSDSKTIEVTVFVPAISASSNTTVCYGSALTLTANAGAGSTYTWSNGSTINSAFVTATTSALYTFTALATATTGLKCTGVGSVQVNIHPSPTVQIVSTRTTICKGEKTLLTASGGTSFTWANMTATTASVLVGPVALNSTTYYSVTATDANGCQATAGIGVKLVACSGIDEFEKGNDQMMIYPNPNDGTFSIRVKENMLLSLTNELGQLIMELRFTEENGLQQSVEGLSSGVYYLKGTLNGSIIQSKLVIE